MRALSLAAALMLVSVLPAVAQTPPPPADEHLELPAGPGRELTIRVCSKCHLPTVVAYQQLDLLGWKTVVDLMASQGALGTDADFDQIVQYLAKAFPEIDTLPN